MKKILVLLIMLVMVNVGYAENDPLFGTVKGKYKNYLGEQECFVMVAGLDINSVLKEDNFKLIFGPIIKPVEAMACDRKALLEILVKAKEWISVAETNKVENLNRKEIGELSVIVVNDLYGESLTGMTYRKVYFSIENKVYKIIFDKVQTKAVNEEFPYMDVKISELTIEKIDELLSLLNDEGLAKYREKTLKKINANNSVKSLFN